MFSFKTPISKPVSQVNNTNQFSWLMFFLLVITPIIVFPSFIVGLFISVNALTYVAIFIFTYIPCVLAIGVYHRYYTHRSFKFKNNFIAKFIEFCMRLFTVYYGAQGGQGDIKTWTLRHTKHHLHEDKIGKDHHTPLEFGGGFKGFIWSHIGWLCYIDVGNFDHKNHSKNKCKELENDPLVVWQYKYHLPLYMFFALVYPFILSYLLSTDILMTFLAVNAGRMLCQHATFAVNSLCHIFGNTPYRNYKTGVAKDNWLIAVLVFGEGFHNGHHAFGYSYENGLIHKGNKGSLRAKFMYILDIHARIIDVFDKLGLLEFKLKPTDEEIAMAAQRNVVFNLEAQFKKLSLEFNAKKNELSGKFSQEVENMKISIYQLSIERKEAIVLLITKLKEAIESCKAKIDQYAHANSTLCSFWKARQQKAEDDLVNFKLQLQITT